VRSLLYTHTHTHMLLNLLTLSTYSPYYTYIYIVLRYNVFPKTCEVESVVT